jgi:chromosome segregation protein
LLLKSLEIRGFKSFADPVAIEFEPGITVIVGPNGSGKSNIVDAICWAMGTQAISTLRTGSMQEVIFAGSPARKPLGRAKVTITLDNSDRSLPIDFSEVAISRTLFRNGESEYAINGAPCRLLDIQELLSDTGVGRQLHSIVGQGQLEAVLAASPDDRRAMIEEAAGVLKYKRRKERALRRLAATEENLARLQDVIREIERQMRPLKRQAAAVERYRDVSAEAARVRQLLARRRLVAARQQHRNSAGAVDAARTKLQNLESLVESLAQQERAISSAQQEVAALWAEVEDSARKVAELRGLCGALGDLAREKKKFFETVAARSAAQHLDLLGAEKDQLDETLAEIERALPVLREELEAAMEDERRLLVEAESLRARIGAGGEVALKAAELAGERSSLESGIARAEIEASQLVETRRAVEQRWRALIEERQRCNEEIQRLDAQSGPLSEEVSRLSAHKELARKEIAELERKRQEAEAEFANWNGRIEALRELASQLASIEAPGRVAEAAPDGVIGVLWELIEVERGSESAVEAALGDLSRAVVVAGEAGIGAAAALLADGESGAAWLLDLESLHEERGIKSRLKSSPVRSVPPPSEAIPLVTLARAKADDESVAEFVQLLLARTYLAPDWDSAVEMSQAYPDLTFVTRDGAVAGAGVYRVGKPSPGPYTQLANLTEVARKAREAENSLLGASKALERRREELEVLESDLATTESALQECDAMLTAAAGDLARIDPEIERIEKERAALEEAESRLVARIGDDRKRLQEIDAFLGDLRTGTTEIESDAAQDDAVAGRLSEVEAALSGARDRRREVEKALAAAEERHAVLSSRRDQLAAKLAEEQKRLEDEEARRQIAIQLSQRSEAAEEAAARLLTDVTALEDETAWLEEAVRPMREVWLRKLSDVRKRLEGVSEELSPAAESLREIELEHVRISTVVEQVEADYQATTGEIPPSDIADVEDSGLPEEILQMDDETAEAHLRALERDLERMGPINQLALKDYEEASGRLEFYTSQAADLQASKKELEKVVSAIDDKIESLFTAAFDDVAESFEATFTSLFPGGTGRLYLQDPSAPLTTGVEVEAKPSGKSVKRLSLLSGGERSLAALAFLFAIYRSRPGPFYILDEVEAALDDVNLERFLRLVTEFRDHGQMVIITHQKRTVEVADCLYGVSMQSEGVSKVLSYKVSESLTYSR